MARLFESGNGLVIGYPGWLILVAVAGAALLVHAARPNAAVRGRWGLLAVSAILLWAGLYWFAFNITLTPESGRIYGLGFAREQGHMDWSQATRVEVLLRQRGKGGPKPFLVVLDGAGRELEIPLAALNGAERNRVVEYVRGRVAAR